MLILSQDKKKITEKIDISIIKNEIYYENGILGEYDTEERAKEVLQEILKRYKDENYYTGKAVYHKQLVYEMPII